MVANFFSSRSSAGTRPDPGGDSGYDGSAETLNGEQGSRFAESDFEVVEEQQALVLGRLQRAAGAPVSYAELRDAGIEFPASVVSELELIGVPIRRCYGGAGGSGVPGVRLDVGVAGALRTSEVPADGVAAAPPVVEPTDGVAASPPASESADGVAAALPASESADGVAASPPASESADGVALAPGPGSGPASALTDKKRRWHTSAASAAVPVLGTRAAPWPGEAAVPVGAPAVERAGPGEEPEESAWGAVRVYRTSLARVLALAVLACVPRRRARRRRALH